VNARGLSLALLGLVLAFLGCESAGGVGGVMSTVLTGGQTTLADYRGATTDIDEPEEIELGRSVATAIGSRYKLLRDDALTRYVALVGNAVALQSDRPDLRYYFAVLDSDEINAFAAPGGYIFVTRGALELMESEAELAGVLGHEISHVDQKHVLEQVRKGNMITGAASENDLNGPVMDKAVETLAGVIFKGLDRGSELESDSLGMLYAAAAGYRPDGLLTFVRRLQANETSPRRGRFLSEMRATHPPTADRVAALERQGPAEGLNMASGQLLEDRFRRYVPRR